MCLHPRGAAIDSQMRYRLREAQDRSRAEDLNDRVAYWSVGETLVLLAVSISQVGLLKSFFTEKQPATNTELLPRHHHRPAGLGRGR